VSVIDPADFAAAVAGDAASFERVVRAAQGKVWRYLVQIVGDQGLAEDLTQDVFVKLHRKLHTVRSPEHADRWVFRVARNAAFDALRSRRRRPLHLLGDEEPVVAAIDPHVSVELSDALGRLDHDMREAITLVTIVGFTYREAAGVAGVAEGTMKSRVFRARRALIEALEVDHDG
jgi:RNA polymerase sigma-70 factor (ECF subfamily)